MEGDKKKQLTLKTKQVQRLTKEYNSYVKECDKISSKIQKEQESGVEEYYINKSKGFLKESEDTRDCVKGKLRTYLDELISFFSEVDTPDVSETEEIKLARETIENGNNIFKVNDN